VVFQFLTCRSVRTDERADDHCTSVSCARIGKLAGYGHNRGRLGIRSAGWRLSQTEAANDCFCNANSEARPTDTGRLPPMPRPPGLKASASPNVNKRKFVDPPFPL